jgi:hypothetical protein
MVTAPVAAAAEADGAFRPLTMTCRVLDLAFFVEALRRSSQIFRTAPDCNACTAPPTPNRHVFDFPDRDTPLVVAPRCTEMAEWSLLVPAPPRLDSACAGLLLGTKPAATPATSSSKAATASGRASVPLPRAPKKKVGGSRKHGRPKSAGQDSTSSEGSGSGPEGDNEESVGAWPQPRTAAPVWFSGTPCSALHDLACHAPLRS